MYNCIHLEQSYIQITNVATYKKFVLELNAIENFTEFFDSFQTDPIVKELDCVELTYNPNTELNYDEIIQLVQDMIQLCDIWYRYNLCLTIKIFDDGEFLLYLIVNNNKYHDITNKINRVIKLEKANAIKKDHDNFWN